MSKKYEPSPSTRGKRTRMEQEETRIIEKEEYRKVADEVFSYNKEDLPKIIETKKKELMNQVQEYAKEHELTRISYTKLYEIMSSGNEYNRTKYSATEVAIAFEVYKAITSDLALKNPKHTPSKQNFCAFLGISTSTYDSYREKHDNPDLVEAVARIDDYLTDIQLNHAQMGLINPTATIFRMKTEHGYVEQKEYIAVNNQVTVDTNDVKQRLMQVKGKTHGNK